MDGFEYPTRPHVRRHGPGGYSGYESYREWLRDEFLFRCVYCLHREQWYGRGATFHIDHFIPVTTGRQGVTDYSNLLYACGTCNESKKSILGLPDPCKIAFNECLRVNPDGSVQTLNQYGQKLEQALRLNNQVNVTYRRRWLHILDSVKRSEPELFKELMGFPANLPDLRKKQAPSNAKPEGVLNCYFVLREKEQLPSIY
jgi:hypothetical protein